MYSKIDIFTDKFFFIIVVSALVVMLFSISSKAENQDAQLKGAMFSDASKISQMKQQWLNRPIKYNVWAEGADMAISLDQHFYHFFLPFIHKFEDDNNLKIAVEKGTCGISGGLLANKSIDMGGFCCSPGVMDRLPQLRFHTLGATSLTILVHPDNPIDNITFDQAQRIFQGKITKWSQLITKNGTPGPIKEIKVVTRLHCKLRPGHWRLLLDSEYLFSPWLYEVGSIPEVIEQVGADRWAIGGFESVYMAFHQYPQKPALKALTIDGYSPYNRNHLISGKYPLHFIFNITTWEGRGVENENAEKLGDYLMHKVDSIDVKYNIVSAHELRKAGWKFKGDELVGEPK